MNHIEKDLRISAVIPTYNRGQIVGRAIESALAQELSPSEIIVIDDGSMDSTRSVVESYGPTVRYVYQPNSGVSAARNRGVREANSEWIAFLDSDDYWIPSHLGRIVSAIRGTNGAAALYFTDLKTPENEGGHQFWSVYGFEIEGDWEFKQDAAEWAMLRMQPMMLQASVISRRAYWEVGGLPEQLRTREDTLLFFKLALLYPACAVSGCGTVLNSDDSIRLTQVYDGKTLVYWAATIFLYNELASLKRISRERRQLFTGLLASSYYGMGRILLSRNDYLGVIKNLAVACRISPSVFVKETLETLGRRQPKKTEAPCLHGRIVAK